MESDIELVQALGQINRRLWKLLSPVFKKGRMSITELLVLSIMSKKKTSRVVQLADFIGVSPSTLSGILDRLVAKGFLKRDRDPGDRRSVSVTATPKLGSFFCKMTAPMEERLRERLGLMPESRKERLTADLKFLLGNLEQDSYGDAKSSRTLESAVRGK
jgi:DNA-binding MarR family transcriptional regulator